MREKIYPTLCCALQSQSKNPVKAQHHMDWLPGACVRVKPATPTHFLIADCGTPLLEGRTSRGCVSGERTCGDRIVHLLHSLRNAVLREALSSLAAAAAGVSGSRVASFEKVLLFPCTNLRHGRRRRQWQS